MKNFLLCLMALAAGSARSSAEVLFCFDSTIEAFELGTDAGGVAENVAWSDFNGGSMALTFATGWKPQAAKLNVRANAALLAEFESALVNGGTLSYQVFIKTEDIVGSFPGWFEPMYIGNSDGVYDQTFGGPRGQPALYGSGAFPAGATQTFTVTYPIEAASSAVNDARAQFKLSSGWHEIFLGLNSGGDGFTSGKFYIDNFRITSNAEPEVIPPPVIALEPVNAGLNIYSSGNGQYDRQTVRTAVPEYSWVGATGPVTYSLTIANYTPQAGYQTVIYLAPGSGFATNNNAPDWGQPVCALAFINNNADGSANMRFAYKNDIASSNGYTGHGYWDTDNAADLYDGITGPGAAGTGKGGTLAYVNSSTILGTWTIRFTSDTNVTITAPDGQTASGSLPNAATAQLFAGPLYAYFGTVPQSTANIGQSAVFSDIKITGLENPVAEDIASALANGLLEKSATEINGVLFVDPAESPYWFTWTLPATDYVLQQSASLGNDVENNDQWQTLATTNSIGNATLRRKLLLSSQLVSLERNYLRMAKP